MLSVSILQYVTLDTLELQVVVVLYVPQILPNRKQVIPQPVTKSVIPSLVDRVTTVQNAVSSGFWGRGFEVFEH